MDDAWQALRKGLFEDAWTVTYPWKGPERSNPSEGVVGRCLEGPMALPFNDTLRHKGGLIETARANPPGGSLMKFSSTNPIGGKNLTFSSNNPFDGKMVTKIGHCSSNPSEGTSPFNQPFQLNRISPRRAPAKTRKRSYEHGKRFLIEKFRKMGLPATYFRLNGVTTELLPPRTRLKINGLAGNVFSLKRSYYGDTTTRDTS